MAGETQIEGVTIFDDEELLHHAKGSEHILIVHGILIAVTFGIWLIWLYVKSGEGGSPDTLFKTEYIITDGRIVVKKDRMGTSTEQISFDDIVGNVRSEQRYMQSLVGVGDIEFSIQRARETAGKSGEFGERERDEREMDIRREEMELTNVRRHHEVADSIRRMNQRSG